jgi:hypothetical protein
VKRDLETFLEHYGKVTLDMVAAYVNELMGEAAERTVLQLPEFQKKNPFGREPTITEHDGVRATENQLPVNRISTATPAEKRRDAPPSRLEIPTRHDRSPLLTEAEQRALGPEQLTDPGPQPDQSPRATLHDRGTRSEPRVEVSPQVRREAMRNTPAGPPVDQRERSRPKQSGESEPLPTLQIPQQDEQPKTSGSKAKSSSEVGRPSGSVSRVSQNRSVPRSSEPERYIEPTLASPAREAQARQEEAASSSAEYDDQYGEDDPEGAEDDAGEEPAAEDAPSADRSEPEAEGKAEESAESAEESAPSGFVEKLVDSLFRLLVKSDASTSPKPAKTPASESSASTSSTRKGKTTREAPETSKSAKRPATAEPESPAAAAVIDDSPPNGFAEKVIDWLFRLLVKPSDRGAPAKAASKPITPAGDTISAAGAADVANSNDPPNGFAEKTISWLFHLIVKPDAPRKAKAPAKSVKVEKKPAAAPPRKAGAAGPKPAVKAGAKPQSKPVRPKPKAGPKKR